jgi:hypothetical protein
MKIKDKKKQVDLKTNVLDLIQRQIDQNNMNIRCIESEPKNSVLEAGMLAHINFRLNEYHSRWSNIDCEKDTFKQSIERLCSEFSELGRRYANPFIGRMGRNIYFAAHDHKWPIVHFNTEEESSINADVGIKKQCPHPERN